MHILGRDDQPCKARMLQCSTRDSTTRCHPMYIIPGVDASALPPCPQWQSLQLQRRWSNEAPKCDGPYKYAGNIGQIIPVSLSQTLSATIQTSMFVCFQSAGERCGDQRSLQLGRRGEFVRIWRDTSGDGEDVHKFEDEVPRKCSAEVRDSVDAPLAD